jgi:uncharacterized protein YoxC
MSGISEGILILIAIICILSTFAILYFIAVMRRLLILTKKIDYLVEDFTYKAEMLNPAIETLSRMSGYVDAFDAVTKRNMNSAIRYFARNRDLIYKLGEKVKEYAENKSGKK